MAAPWTWFGGPAIVATPGSTSPPGQAAEPNIYIWDTGLAAWREVTVHEWHLGAWVEMEPRVRFVEDGQWKN